MACKIVILSRFAVLSVSLTLKVSPFQDYFNWAMFIDEWTWQDPFTVEAVVAIAKLFKGLHPSIRLLTVGFPARRGVPPFIPPPARPELIEELIGLVDAWMVDREYSDPETAARLSQLTEPSQPFATEPQSITAHFGKVPSTVLRRQTPRKPSWTSSSDVGMWTGSVARPPPPMMSKEMRTGLEKGGERTKSRSLALSRVSHGLGSWNTTATAV